MDEGSVLPRARSEGLLSQRVDDEVVVYDTNRHTAWRLNRTAALVWENADGERTAADLIEVLRDEIGDLADQDLVTVTLDRLEEHALLEEGFERRADDVSRTSRRRFIRRVGLVGTAAAVLPVIQSVVVPAAAHAAGSPTCSTCSTCSSTCSACRVCSTCST